MRGSGSSERGRQPPAARSGTTRTGPLPPTRARPEGRQANECSRKAGGCESSGSRRRSSAEAVGTRTPTSPRPVPSSAMWTARRALDVRRISHLVRRGLHWPRPLASGSRRRAFSQRFQRRIRSATSLAISFAGNHYRESSTSISMTPISWIAAEGSARLRSSFFSPVSPSQRISRASQTSQSPHPKWFGQRSLSRPRNSLLLVV